MRRHIPAAETQARPSRSLAGLFGLGEGGSAWVVESRRAQVRLAGAAMPFALVAQLIAAAVVAGLGLGIAGASLAGLIAPAMLGLFATGGAWYFLTAKAPRKLAMNAQVGVALGLGAGLGVLQALLLWEATQLPGGAAASACAAAAAAALVIGIAAFLPIRIAGLALGGAAACTFALLSGGTVGVVALLFLGCLSALVHRLASTDLKEIATRARAESESVLARRLVREFENHGTGWFWETDRNGRLTYVSAKVAKELGVPREEVIGHPLTAIFDVDGAPADTERSLSFHLSSRMSFSEYSVQAAGGSGDRWWSISGRPMVDKLGQFRGFIGTGSDLTAKRRSEAEITRLALFDSLTGLANRQRMRLALDQAISHQSGGYRPSSLFLIDLDRFKAVNDTLGHQVGDELLKQVADRLQRAIGDAGLVGRLGGDEFTVVLPGEGDRETMARLAKAVIVSLSQPYALAGKSISIGASIGIAVAPADGDNSETLVRNADLALYAAKADGRGLHRFYREEMLVGAQSRKELEDDLRRALSDNQFHLAYQPVVSTIGAKIVGFEALIRWNHPRRGAVSPSEFIPIAEECGLIDQIGEWVLRTACAEAASWPTAVRVGVNVSPIQFANPALPKLVMNTLAQTGLDADRLELEITEGVFVDESASTDAMFASLKAIGVRLALDDFGTGYSSLGYLRKAPFDKIKIDQSFVRGAAIAGSRNAAIIKAIVTLANTLGMETTAEGAEIQDEIELIRELGCSHIQGYVYGRPMIAAEAVRLLLAQGGTASASGHKVSRVPRTKMLRSATLEIGDVQYAVRIRDVSRTGAMIDGFTSGQLGDEVMIELMEDQMFRAVLRWMRDGKCGLEFAEPFDLERMNGPAEPISIRRRA
jgi:diguanylate cyclase (GGDEF)-like protein/PAS domain S-box-containing protein